MNLNDVPKRQFLPSELRSRVQSGFSEPELIELCDGKWADRPSGAPWRYWDTELYSQGELLREIVGWPRWLPIPVSGEHGTLPSFSFWPRGHERGVRDFLTTSPIKIAAVSRPRRLRVHLIQSPWQDWILRRNIRIWDDAEGTLAFIPHLLPGMLHDDEYIDALVIDLQSLPDEFQPVVACIHMHDVRNGLGRALRDRGLPVVSAGNTSDARFFGRWVEIAQHFRFATSPQPGSELLNFHALGGSFFVFGPRSNKGDSAPSNAESISRMTSVEKHLEDARAIFIQHAFAFPPNPRERPQQDAFWSVYHSEGPRLHPKQLKRLFLRRMPFLGFAYYRKWFRYAWRARPRILARLKSRLIL